MKIDFSQKLLDLDGQEIPKERDKDGKAIGTATMTLGFAAARALCIPLQGDDLKPEDVIKRHELAARITKGGEVEITAEDAVLLSTRAAKYWALEISGPACKMLKG